ncbi:reverse transcriptase [compost metagenome]
MKHADGCDATTLRVSATEMRTKAGSRPLSHAFRFRALSLEGSHLWAFFMRKIEEWNRFFLSRGVSQEIIESHLARINKLVESGSPIIFENEHLSLLLGIKYDVLLKMVNGSSSFYRQFTIKKRLGGVRVIEAPYPSLLHCQDWIYKNILLKVPVHDCAHGFVPGRSIFTNAKVHLSCSTLLKMDLKDFFPSIGIGWVINFFSGLGYSEMVAYSLAALCCNYGRLVQGSATSPYLTNILLYKLDERLGRIASKYGLRYTRYADDLTFSGRYISKNVPPLISAIVGEFGLTINDSKTRLLIEKNKKLVTGLSVAGDSLRITRELRRTIKKEVFYIKKFGFQSHISQSKIRDPFYLESISGKVSFWLQAEPTNTEALECRNILKSQACRDV